MNSQANGSPTLPLMATLPALYPEWLGDRSFSELYGTRFPYVVGAMANGIATVELVVAAARSGLLGFFGAAGLSFDRVQAAVTELNAQLGSELPWGANLIHSPTEPELEQRVAAMYIEQGVRLVSASAYMELSPAIVHYALSGITEGPAGEIDRRHHVFAKVSRPEVAAQFMSPAPARIVERLLADGRITRVEAELAKRVPIAEDITVESDSGGHTDNRPLGSLFPIIARAAVEYQERFAYSRRFRVGAAGGLGTPAAVAAAFGLGAAYVLTGSVNQCAVESGLSEEGRVMLCGAGVSDMMMAPAADMFEMGVKLQVLKRGTLFGPRAIKLDELYRNYDSLEAIPAETKTKLERDIFGQSVDSVWTEVEQFFSKREPKQLERASRDAKHRMALIFRWYLGLSSRWAIAGNSERRSDYQIWCGPAMGAFNDWVRGSELESAQSRTVSQIALNLLEGAAVLTRAHQLRTYGVATPPELFQFHPRQLS